ncbi:hypothetical protein L332_03655 [Agrococcus pavilionensis RW1]|uniref:Uncharacterized protein n=1 Tax=Agrococcus pavilionensis RW1 TaxID=1330458 RepID=U1LNK0_9MICO|nr:hypothetical protein [Agrococcus pavilionensis]ERG63547.1 hypothetical protein L332_03655 [Agrococcus pavilionensis RW1]
MAVDGGYGPKGRPEFDPNGGFEDWVDLEAVGAFAGDVGNRKVGTAARRAGLSTSTTAADQVWVGLEYRETDTGETFVCTSLSPVTWENVTHAKTNTTFALVGTVPGSLERLQFRAFRGVVTLGASGTGEVGYPGGAFPNAVLAAFVDLADADGLRGWNANLRNQTVQNLSTVRFIVTDADGLSVASGTSVPVVVFAIGF